MRTNSRRECGAVAEWKSGVDAQLVRIGKIVEAAKGHSWISTPLSGLSATIYQRRVATVMAKRAIPNFSGILKMPIAKSLAISFGVDLPDTTTEERATALRRGVARERLRRLGALLAHYGIKETDRNAWLWLALSLATEFVPGFRYVEQMPRRARPKEKRAQELKQQLCSEIDGIRALKPGCSVVTAIRIAIRQTPEKWGEYRPSTLETRYHELKKKQNKTKQREDVWQNQVSAGLLTHLFNR